MQKKVLVIDDDIEIGKAIKSILEFDDFEVVTAVNPEEGLQKALDLKPAVILLDLFLPGMNGFEVYKQLKNNERTTSIPVIIITGHTDEVTISMIREFGLTGIFYKPFYSSQLRKKILNLFNSTEPEIKKCKKCGRIMDETWKYCPFDGLNQT
jgi:two-component system alkaline phosphatase synthesis response regulator PhoP